MKTASVLDVTADVFDNVFLQLCAMLTGVGLTEEVVAGLAYLHSCIVVANVTHQLPMAERSKEKQVITK